jgi:protein-S-isoprenylcysteine O-methyltransferase Ste14
MPRLAIAFCILWFVSLFLVRSVIQWKRTGSTGIKGFHGRVGSLPWLAGTTASVGMLLAAFAPVGALRDWPGGALLFSSQPFHVAGAVFAFVGIVGALLAQLAMGDSWRIGVDETETTSLVTTGLYSWVRNPIFTFIWLSLLGLVLISPNPISLLAGALTVAGIELQVRVVEEPYLIRTHDAEYGDYASRVGRFLPGFGLLRPARRVVTSDSSGG